MAQMLQAKLFEETGSVGGGIKIPVGIHEGVAFSGLTSDSTWSDLNFTSKDGRVIHKRLFMPTGSTPREGETIQQAYDREVSQNLNHVVQVMKAVLGQEVVDNFEAPDYKSFLAGVLLLLNAKKGSLVNLKVVPDYKEAKYPDLPKYGTYVEKYVEGTSTTLKFSANETKALEQMEQSRNSSSKGAMSADELGSLV